MPIKIQPPQEKKASLEELTFKFVQAAEIIFQNHETTWRNQQAPIQNFENQVGQIAKALSKRSQGEDCQVIPR